MQGGGKDTGGGKGTIGWPKSSNLGSKQACGEVVQREGRSRMGSDSTAEEGLEKVNRLQSMGDYYDRLEQKRGNGGIEEGVLNHSIWRDRKRTGPTDAGGTIIGTGGDFSAGIKSPYFAEGTTRDSQRRKTERNQIETDSMIDKEDRKKTLVKE